MMGESWKIGGTVNPANVAGKRQGSELPERKRRDNRTRQSEDSVSISVLAQILNVSDEKSGEDSIDDGIEEEQEGLR